MRYTGVLGFPRLSSIPPLVSSESEYSAAVSDQRAKSITKQVVEENDLPTDDLTEEQIDIFIESAAEKLYDDDDAVSEATKFRFQKCMKGSWVSSWVQGLEESDMQNPPRTDIEKLEYMMKACAGMTRSQTSDNELLVPERFRS